MKKKIPLSVRYDVFIWNAYGCVDVYKIDTEEQCKELYERFKDIVRPWADKEDITKCDNYNDVAAVKRERYIESIQYLLSTIGTGDIDPLDHGTGFAKLK